MSFFLRQLHLILKICPKLGHVRRVHSSRKLHIQPRKKDIVYVKDIGCCHSELDRQLSVEQQREVLSCSMATPILSTTSQRRKKKRTGIWNTPFFLKVMQLVRRKEIWFRWQMIWRGRKDCLDTWLIFNVTYTLILYTYIGNSDDDSRHKKRN